MAEQMYIYSVCVDDAIEYWFKAQSVKTVLRLFDRLDLNWSDEDIDEFVVRRISAEESLSKTIRDEDSGLSKSLAAWADELSEPGLIGSSLD